eukprot:4227376-Amphidinium_carterae.1
MDIHTVLVLSSQLMVYTSQLSSTDQGCAMGYRPTDMTAWSKSGSAEKAVGETKLWSWLRRVQE